MLLVVAVVGGAIFSVAQSESLESTSGFSGGDVQVDDFGVTSGDELELILRNADSNGVTVNSVNVSDGDRFTEWIGGESISVGDTGSVSLANVTEGDGANSLDVTVNYDSGALTNLQVEGSISGNMQIISDSTVSAGNGEENGGGETVSASGAPSFDTEPSGEENEDEWVPVSPDSGTDQGFSYFFDETSDEEYYNVSKGFYVMKYEAKPYNEGAGEFDSSSGEVGHDTGYVPRSVADYKPWREISFNEGDPENGYGAVQACEALNDDPDIGSDYEFGLVTNREWMTVARQIEQNDGNWVDGEVDSNGQLIRGWSDGDFNNDGPLAASTDDSDSFYRIDEFLSEEDIEDHQERTFELANGEVVWDWAGNVHQMVYAEDSGGSTTNGVFDEDDPDGKEYEKDPAVVDRSTDGVGTDDGFEENDAALRGAAWYPQGVFYARSRNPANSNDYRGFRCSAVPVS